MKVIQSSLIRNKACSAFDIYTEQKKEEVYSFLIRHYNSGLRVLLPEANYYLYDFADI